MADVFDEMVDRWGSPLVARTEVHRFCGGATNGRTLANLDSLGVGIPGRFRIGKRVVYPVKNLVQFLRERAREIEQ